MSHIETLSLFPTAISKFKLHGGFTDEEISFIANLDQRKNISNTTSKNHSILFEPELKRISNFCTSSLNQYIDNVINPKNDIQPYITQSWANYTEKGQAHQSHVHPNSFISGILYVENDSDDLTQFDSPLPETMFQIPPEEYNTFNSRSCFLKAEKGVLYVFPSTLRHEVPVKNSEGTRITLSFNSFLKGTLGGDNLLTELIL